MTLACLMTMSLSLSLSLQTSGARVTRHGPPPPWASSALRSEPGPRSGSLERGCRPVNIMIILLLSWHCTATDSKSNHTSDNVIITHTKNRLVLVLIFTEYRTMPYRYIYDTMAWMREKALHATSLGALRFQNGACHFKTAHVNNVSSVPLTKKSY